MNVPNIHIHMQIFSINSVRDCLVLIEDREEARMSANSHSNFSKSNDTQYKIRRVAASKAY